MIIMKYTGGMGNQMFQYAMSCVLKEKYPKLNIFAERFRYRFLKEHEGFCLDKYFFVHIEEAPRSIMKKVVPCSFFLALLRCNYFLRGHFTGKIEKLDVLLGRKKEFPIISDYYSTGYNDMALCLNTEENENWYFRGNWINSNYFLGYENFIRQQFQFRENLLSMEDKDIIEQMKSVKSVAIHIRRGDYVGDEEFDLCNRRYFVKALSELQHILKCKRSDLKIYIFTEGSEPIKGFEDDCYISHPGMDGIDMWMMSKCRYNIISNSTFSYWAAFLNDYEGKIIFAPEYAYKYKIGYRRFPVPVDWIKIDNLSV